MPILTTEIMPGAIIRANKRTITPFSQYVRIALPFVPGGVLWSRPVSILVQEQDGSEQVLPVQDVTRIAQLVFLAFGLAAGMLLWRSTRR